MKNLYSHSLFSLLACLALTAAPADADIWSQCPPDIDGIDTDGDGIDDNDHVCWHVSAGDGFVNMADGRLQYMFGFGDVNGIPDSQVMAAGALAATMPSPTIVVKEGQKLFLNLSNVGMMIRPDLFDPHSIHWHGFPEAAPIFDGVPGPSLIINMGQTFTYFYNVVEPGTYIYHCHVEASEHMQMGMMGNLYVLPIQNNLPDGTDLNGFTHQTGYKYVYNDGDGSTNYDVEYPIQIHTYDAEFHDASLYVQPLPFANMDDNYAMFNGRGYPDTVREEVLWNNAFSVHGYGEADKPSMILDSRIRATPGQKVLLRITNVSTTNFFTLSTTLGIPMKVVGRGARLLRSTEGKDTTFETAALNTGGGDAFDVILDTTDVTPGTYFLYTTNLNFLSNNTEDYGGMMTEIVIEAPGPARGPDEEGSPKSAPAGGRNGGRGPRLSQKTR